MTGNPSLFPYHDHVHQSLDNALVLAESSIQELLSLGGDEAAELVSQLVDLYLEDSSSRTSVALAAFQAGDMETVYRAAHALKSSSANMGAMELSRLCAQIEALEHAESDAPSAAQIDQMGTLYGDVERALRELRSLCEA